MHEHITQRFINSDLLDQKPTCQDFCRLELTSVSLYISSLCKATSSSTISHFLDPDNILITNSKCFAGCSVVRFLNFTEAN